jgi:probable addiction module antidote protein
MSKKSRKSLGSSLSEMTIEMLRSDVDFREEYIKNALAENNPALLGKKLRNIVDALGGIGKLSQATGLNRTSLYRSFSGERIPDLSTIEKVFGFAGFALSVVRKGNNKKLHCTPAHV